MRQPRSSRPCAGSLRRPVPCAVGNSAGVTRYANAIILQSVTPRARPEPPSVKWDALAPETKATLSAGVDEAARGEFADLTPGETEHYLQTGELPERVERWLDSYDSRRRT
jgi:hypothetical protein